MALQKPIKQSNGIVVNYHRISNIDNIINGKTNINVISYVDEEQREKEKHQPKYSPNREEIYKVFDNVSIEYNDTLTIEEAYEYLKTTDKYFGATDI